MTISESTLARHIADNADKPPPYGTLEIQDFIQHTAATLKARVSLFHLPSIWVLVFTEGNFSKSADFRMKHTRPRVVRRDNERDLSYELAFGVAAKKSTNSTSQDTHWETLCELALP
jgi:hypothetical protein